MTGRCLCRSARVPCPGHFRSVHRLPILFGRASPQSSFELIEEALRLGEVDAETALIYQVYAITLDPRLPAKYRGVDKDDLESDALSDAVRRWDSLSAKAQALTSKP